LWRGWRGGKRKKLLTRELGIKLSHGEGSHSTTKGGSKERDSNRKWERGGKCGRVNPSRKKRKTQQGDMSSRRGTSKRSNTANRERRNNAD